MELLIENLTKQLKNIIEHHPVEVDKDTYWRGVKIGLETAIDIALDVVKNEHSTNQ